MITDILTVMWRERKSLFRQQGSRGRALFSLLVPVAVFGIFMPWQEGPGWVDGYWSLITSVFIPMLLVGTIIPESFAGERERHTLGTLLASRLPDRAILLGKIANAVLYGWFATLAILLLGLITVNTTAWSGHLTFFAPALVLVHLALSLLLAGCMSGLGVLISLRAATVQGATQALMAATMLPFLILGVLATSVFTLQVEWVEGVKRVLEGVSPAQVIAVIMVVLLVAFLSLLWAAMARFRRGRLLLS